MNLKGYEISNSLRFNDDDSANLQRTFSSDGNKRVWTISTWLKRSIGFRSITNFVYIR